MSQGDLWLLPSGHKGIEVSRTRDYVMISRIVDGWPYPEPPREYLVSLCTKQPSRYLNGDVPEDEAC